MYKKFFYCACAASMMLFTACQDDLEQGLKDGESVVTFNAELPSNLQSRTFADGKTATNLTYAVYEAGQNTPLIVDSTSVKFSDLKATVQLRLVNGKSYDILFWADNENAPYSFDANAKTVTVNYNGIAANAENCDAFFVAEKALTVDGTINKDVKLTRPFAQLNIGATDATQAATAGFTTSQTSVKVANIYSTVNLYTGEVTGETEVTYAMSNKPSGETFPATVTAEYLAMNYLLVDEKKLIDVEFTASNGSHQVVRNYSNVPVQRNYQTNIYGNILTEQTNFNVEIVPAFEGTEDRPVAVVDGIQYQTINDAIEAGFKSIFLPARTTPYTLGAMSNKEVTIEGESAQGVTISVPTGNSSVNLNNSNVTFKNVTLTRTNVDYGGFIHSGEMVFDGCIFNNVYWCYGPSEFNDCTFNQESDNAYNVWTYGAKIATFNRCTFNSKGKAALVYKEEGTEWYTANFNDCTFTNSASEPAKNFAGKECAAIEIDAHLNPYNVNIKNCKQTGFGDDNATGNALWNLKSGTMGVNANITVEGLDASKNAVVSLSTDDAASGCFTTIQAAMSAVADGATIRLKAGTYNEVLDLSSDKGLNFQPAEGSRSATEVVIAGIDAQHNGNSKHYTFKNITINNANQTATGWFTGTGKCNPCVGLWGGNFTFEDCTFVVDGKGGYETGIMTWWTVTSEEHPACKLALKNCEFKDNGGASKAEARGMQIYGYYDVEIDGCTFNTEKRYAFKYVGGDKNATNSYVYTCNIKNSKFNNCEYGVELGSSQYPGKNYKVVFGEGNTLGTGVKHYKIANTETNQTVEGSNLSVAE